jgi:hypothetical protein
VVVINEVDGGRDTVMVYPSLFRRLLKRTVLLVVKKVDAIASTYRCDCKIDGPVVVVVAGRTASCMHEGQPRFRRNVFKFPVAQIVIQSQSGTWAVVTKKQVFPSIAVIVQKTSS